MLEVIDLHFSSFFSILSHMFLLFSEQEALPSNFLVRLHYLCRNVLFKENFEFDDNQPDDYD